MNEPIPAEPSLIDVARALYLKQGTTISHRDIARHMGASKEWVRNFIAGDIKNPGVLTLEKFIAAIKANANV